MKRVALAIWLCLPASFLPQSAHAYCRSTICDLDACSDEPGEAPPPSADCPALYWPRSCVGFSVQEDGGNGLSDGLSADTVELITELAFDQWRSADCGGGARPGLHIVNFGQVPCGQVQYNQRAGNANIVVFNAEWPHSDASHTFALTTTSFDPVTGELLTADIELNSRDYGFSVNDESVEVDLLSVLVHETGHFLGLGHTSNETATMFPTYIEGTTDLRNLDPDDERGICDIYPPDDSIDETCNPLPKHGFSPECRDDQTEGGCTASPSAPEGRAGAVLAICVALAFTARSARRSRSRTRSA